MINKWWEIICDSCGCAEHFSGTKKQAEQQAIENDWIIISGRHFDSHECVEEDSRLRVLFGKEV